MIDYLFELMISCVSTPSFAEDSIFSLDKQFLDANLT